MKRVNLLVVFILLLNVVFTSSEQLHAIDNTNEYILSGEAELCCTTNGHNLFFVGEIMTPKLIHKDYGYSSPDNLRNIVVEKKDGSTITNEITIINDDLGERLLLNEEGQYHLYAQTFDGTDYETTFTVVDEVAQIQYYIGYLHPIYQVETAMTDSFKSYSNTFQEGIDLEIKLIPFVKECEEHSIFQQKPSVTKENWKWSVDDKNIASWMDDLSLLHLHKDGQVTLTCTFDDKTIEAIFYSEKEGIHIDMIDDTLEITTNKFYEPLLTKSVIMNGMVDNEEIIEFRYLLTEEMQEKYGVQYLSAIEGILEEGTYTVLENLAGHTIDFNLVAIDKTAEHHLQCEAEISGIRDEIDQRYQNSEITYEESLHLVSLAEDKCDCANVCPQTMILDGKEVTHIPLSVTFLEDTVENNANLLTSLREYIENDGNILRSHSAYLTNLLFQVQGVDNGMHGKQMEFNYSQLLDFNYCLEKALSQTIEIDVTGDDVKAVEGLPTAAIKTFEGMSEVSTQTLMFTSELETNELNLKAIHNEAIKQNADVLATYDLSVKQAIGLKSTNTMDESTLVNLTTLTTPITITMEIPKDYDASKNDLKVLHYHNGLVETLDCTVNQEGVSFISQTFSTYSIVQIEKEKEENIPAPPSSSDNNQNNNNNTSKPSIPEISEKDEPIQPEENIKPDQKLESQLQTSTGDTNMLFKIIPMFFFSLYGLVIIHKKNIKS